MNVLAVDSSGVPKSWVSFEDAICYHARNRVVWSLGDTIATFHGGYKNDGTQSILETQSIIAIKGRIATERLGKVALNNRTLFSRDRNMCAYCGNVRTHHDLSRDHVVPKAKGGKDIWTNVVTACKPCNSRKGSKMLEKINSQLLYVPYEPNYYESMILLNRYILQDQMEYLLAGVPKTSRVWNLVSH